MPEQETCCTVVLRNVLDKFEERAELLLRPRSDSAGSTPPSWPTSPVAGGSSSGRALFFRTRPKTQSAAPHMLALFLPEGVLGPSALLTALASSVFSPPSSSPDLRTRLTRKWSGYSRTVVKNGRHRLPANIGSLPAPRAALFLPRTFRAKLHSAARAGA
jgi:hypothetical protein